MGTGRIRISGYSKLKYAGYVDIIIFFFYIYSDNKLEVLYDVEEV